MRTNPRNERINWEISHLLIPKYGGQYLEWDYEDYTWIHIKRFHMPVGWSKTYSALLIEIPPFYPNIAPSKFYADKKMCDRKGFSASHYFAENTTYNPYAHLDWAWLCIHILDWNPRTDIKRGDNLLTVCNLIYHTLSTGK